MEQAHTQLIAQLNERISAADNTPLYMKFAQTVKNAVRSGILEHGNILPGERDLSQLTGVSRITVRYARRCRPGRRGCSNTCPRLRNANQQYLRVFAQRSARFSQQVVLRGKNRIRCGLTKELYLARKRWHSSWLLSAGSDVFLLKRIRYVDEDAVSIEESWVPAHLIHDVDAIGVSLYDYFRSQHIFPQRTRSRVSARMPDAEFRAHIQMDSKVPVLVIKQVALDQQQRPIEYSISYCRSDLYVLCARVAPRVMGRNRRHDAQLPGTPPRYLTALESASVQPDASPASMPPAWLSPAPIVSMTAVANAGTQPDVCALKYHAPSLS